jgi:hypothetical protein
MSRENKVETQDGFFHYSPDGDETSFVSINSIIEKIKVESSDRILFCKVNFLKL